MMASCVLMAMACGSAAQAVNASSTSALNKGEMTLDARVFYFDRRFDLPDTPPARALTGGGIAKYETVAFNSLKAALGFYGSFSLFGIIDRELGTGTALLQSDNDDIAFVGEAYVDYDTGQNQLKAGRQRLATPLINDRDFRILPSVFEAMVYRNRSLTDTTLEAGYVYSESGIGSTYSGFEQQTKLWGQDGLGYIYGGTTVNDISLRGQFVNTLESSGLYRNFSYLDTNVPISVGTGTHIQAQAGGTAYQAEPSATMFGFKLSTLLSRFSMALVYNQIRTNKYSAVEAGPLFTDWQQGYGNYEPSEALGVQLGYDFNNKLHLSAGYVDIESVDGDDFNLDTYVESVFDLQYKFNQSFNVRLRYSEKNQAQDSDREDRQDFRVIFYYEL